MYIEVIECENVFTVQLTPKLLDNNLQIVKSQDNLLLAASSTGAGGSQTGTGVESETNSQSNFNMQDSAPPPPPPPPPAPPLPPSSVHVVSNVQTTEVTKPTETTTTTSTSVPKTSNCEPTNSLFDQNNFDRWSISSDVGPINNYSNGNNYFRVKKYR